MPFISPQLYITRPRTPPAAGLAQASLVLARGGGVMNIESNMNQIIEALSKLNDESIRDGISYSHLEITLNNNEVLVTSNKDGLIQLALEILKLANKNTKGAHLHVDEVSLADKADINLVISIVQ